MSSLLIPLTGQVPVIGHPGDLLFPEGVSVWGSNPHGGPLYRIVWSESRTWMLGGCWGNDGQINYRHAPYYFGRKEWVLERWLPSIQWAGTKTNWEQSMIDGSLAQHGIGVYTMGPYPTEGWFEHVYSFAENEIPDIASLAEVFEQSKNYNFQQLKTALLLHHKKKREDYESNLQAALEDAMPVGGFAASNLNPAKPHADMAGLDTPEKVADAMAKYQGKETSNRVHVLPPQRTGVSMGRRIAPDKSKP